MVFKNKARDPESPANISYRIDCLSNKTEIVPDTAVTPAAEVEITLKPAINIIVDQNKTVERRLVTVTATYGADDALVREYEYNIKNMRMKI